MDRFLRHSRLLNWVSLAMRSNGKYLEAMSSLIEIAMERAGAVDTLMRSEASRGSERLRSALLDSITHAIDFN